MVFEHIEQLKSEFTDKYVVVDKNRPELRRFEGQTGVVKTVNMSGRALVEFDANENVAWYDIDVDFLKVIDAPLPKEEKPAEAAKPKATAPKKKATAGAPASKASGMSVEEMLAAARGAKPAAGKPAAKSVPQKPAGSATGDSRKMSVAEMLAAARGEKRGAVVAPTSDQESEQPKETASAATESSSAEAPASSAPLANGPLPTDTDAIVTWCRQRDG